MTGSWQLLINCCDGDGDDDDEDDFLCPPCGKLPRSVKLFFCGHLEAS